MPPATLPPGRIFLANVGVNAGHRACSPRFPDGTFEFVPIPESSQVGAPPMQTYRDLAAFTAPERSLAEFVPLRQRSLWVHNDPEFTTFTYGDTCQNSPRASALTLLRPGDYLFFLARLVAAGSRDGTSAGPPGPTRVGKEIVPARTPAPERQAGVAPKLPAGGAGFFLIGFLHLEAIVADLHDPPRPRLLRRIAANAHVRRAMAQGNRFDGFWVFCGSRHSRRFSHAVPFTRAVASRLLRAANGQPWRWDEGRTDLQVIGSYTRTCRCLLDPARPADRARIDAWWRHLARSNPHLPLPHLDSAGGAML